MNFGKFGETETLLLNARSIIACFTAVESSVLSPGFRLFFACSEAVAMLPALVPEMTYEGMAVADGTDAGVAWEALVRGSLDQSERENT